MIIVDVETSGVDPKKHSLLSIGAIDFDNPKNEFYVECRAFEGAHISEEATAINGIGKDVAFDVNRMSEETAVKKFIEWMKGTSDHTVAGQNPQFDVSFIIEASHRYGIDISIPHRVIDLHSICFYHMYKRGIKVPLQNNRSGINSDKITEYVGIPAEQKPHSAISGAKWEVEAFSRLLNDKYMYEEYKDFKIPWLC